jgi:hypothetical protein
VTNNTFQRHLMECMPSPVSSQFCRVNSTTAQLRNLLSACHEHPARQQNAALCMLDAIVGMVRGLLSNATSVCTCVFRFAMYFLGGLGWWEVSRRHKAPCMHAYAVRLPGRLACCIAACACNCWQQHHGQLLYPLCTLYM